MPTIRVEALTLWHPYRLSLMVIVAFLFLFRLGPENGPLALPKLWELLPGLHNLQHLE